MILCLYYKLKNINRWDTENNSKNVFKLQMIIQLKRIFIVVVLLKSVEAGVFISYRGLKHGTS